MRAIVHVAHTLWLILYIVVKLGKVYYILGDKIFTYPRTAFTVTVFILSELNIASVLKYCRFTYYLMPSRVFALIHIRIQYVTYIINIIIILTF